MRGEGYLIVRERHNTMFLSLTSFCFVISKSFLKSSLPFSISDSYFFNSWRTSSFSLSSTISSSSSRRSVSSISCSTGTAGSMSPLPRRLLTICFAIKGTQVFGMRILFFHKRQECNISCSLDCGGQLPLMGRAIPGHFPCQDLPALGHITPQTLQILIVNKRYLVGTKPAEFPF